MRSNQLEALDKIWGCLEKGITNITLIAPTGAGKSAIADTMFNYYISLNKKCLYLNPYNQLVDQFENSDFENVSTIKGRGSKKTSTGKPTYPCLAGKIDAGVGWCQSDRCPSSKRKRNCKSKPYGACDTCVCWKCLYKKAYNNFKHSDKGNSNFSLFLLGVDNNPDVVVFDECDMMEGNVRDHYSVTIPKLINDPDFRHHVEPLTAYLEELSLQIDAIDPDSDATTDEQLKDRKELMKRFEKISFLLADVETHQEPWVVSVEKEKQKTKYEPITIERFLDPLLKDKIVFMMSATPPKFPGYTMIEVDSIFPIETRQWYYVPLGKMSMDYRDGTIPALAWWLSQLKGKTLLHAVSYKTAEKISNALRILGKYPLLQINHNNGDEHTISRFDAVNGFVTAQDENKIMLSVKLDRGIDLWQPDILNNVIAVIPWPNPSDALTRAKNRLLGSTWQDEEMARTIAQGMGRIFRSEQMGSYNGIETPKRGYIIDSNFRRWYANNKKLFPKWFREAQIKTIPASEK